MPANHALLWFTLTCARRSPAMAKATTIETTFPELYLLPELGLSWCSGTFIPFWTLANK